MTGRRAPGPSRLPAAAMLAWIALATAASVATAAEKYRIDLDHSFAHFAVVHTGISSVRGRMAVARGSASLDREAGEARVEVEMDAASVETGVKRLDALLIGEMFFDTGRHKAIRFVGRGARYREGLPTEFPGELTIKGITKPVTLVADRFVCRQVKILVLERYVCGGDLHAVVKRSDFGLDKYADMVSDEVRLTISAEAIREE